METGHKTELVTGIVGSTAVVWGWHVSAMDVARREREWKAHLELTCSVRFSDRSWRRFLGSASWKNFVSQYGPNFPRVALKNFFPEALIVSGLAAGDMSLMGISGVASFQNDPVFSDPQKNTLPLAALGASNLFIMKEYTQQQIISGRPFFTHRPLLQPDSELCRAALAEAAVFVRFGSRNIRLQRDDTTSRQDLSPGVGLIGALAAVGIGAKIMIALKGLGAGLLIGARTCASLMPIFIINLKAAQTGVTSA